MKAIPFPTTCKINSCLDHWGVIENFNMVKMTGLTQGLLGPLSISIHNRLLEAISYSMMANNSYATVQLLNHFISLLAKPYRAFSINFWPIVVDIGLIRSCRAFGFWHVTGHSGHFYRSFGFDFWPVDVVIGLIREYRAFSFWLLVLVDIPKNPMVLTSDLL